MNGNGHEMLAGFLKTAKVNALICGGIGNGAQSALSEAGIQLYAGVTGPADEAVKAFLEDKLIFDPAPHCDHHEDHHEGERDLEEEPLEFVDVQGSVPGSAAAAERRSL